MRSLQERQSRSLFDRQRLIASTKIGNCGLAPSG